MKTITQQKLDEIKENAQSLAQVCTEATDNPGNVKLHVLFNNTSTLLDKAHEAGIISKDLMTKAGIWLGDEAQETKIGLLIKRDRRFWDKKQGEQEREYSAHTCADMFKKAARHVIKWTNRIEDAHRRNITLSTANTYGRQQRRGPKIHWELPKLSA